jgi:aspartyl-tRNA(Asn)/glutamyl-tRNA(Gln) amidotransferase subunit A
MSDLMKLTLAGARDALRAGETTAVELAEASLAGRCRFKAFECLRT